MKSVETEEQRFQNTVSAFIENAHAELESEMAKRPRSLSPTAFLCKSAVREFLLEYARENRAHKFSRVSEETLRELNELVRKAMIHIVRSMPSKGKTI